MWLDTKIDLLAGAQVQFTSTGTASYPSTDSKGQPKVQTFSAEGIARGWRDLVHQYPVANSGHGALIARIGAGDGFQPFAIDQTQKTAIPVPGRLFLGLNQGVREAGTAQGSFHVTIAVISAGTGDASAPFLPDTRVSSVDSELLGKIPRRVKDPAGNAGDMVNILLIGTQDDVTAAFKAAGWVEVDRSVADTVLTGALATFSKEAYLTMPMSILYLFGRPQDYGFAHAEPVKVIESRNHLRAWKSAYEADGRPVWCIAATHDIGFERDQRNNGLTHKIDPAIDGERGRYVERHAHEHRPRRSARACRNSARRAPHGQNGHRRRVPFRRPHPCPRTQRQRERSELTQVGWAALADCRVSRLPGAGRMNS